MLHRGDTEPSRRRRSHQHHARPLDCELYWCI